MSCRFKLFLVEELLVIEYGGSLKDGVSSVQSAQESSLWITRSIFSTELSQTNRLM